MGVTTNLINKPLNPRAQDASPLAYNRAALYSGKALSFDGVNDEVNCGDIDVAFSEISFAFHFNADSFSNNCIFQKESVFRFIGINTNQIDIVLATAGNSWYSKKMTLTNLESKDYFLTATYDGSELKAYLNGVLVDTLGDYSGSVVSVSQNVYVGRTNGGLYYNGKVSGTKIFNTALTPAQIADLYNFPEKIVPTGVANTALKLWLPMMESAGTTAFNGAPDALGSEEVTNGDFSEGATDWLLARGWSVSNNTLINDGSVTTAQALQEMSINGTAGTIYALTFNVLSATNADLRFYSPNVGYVSQTINTGDSVTYLLESDGSYNYLTGRNYSGAEIILDNLSVKELTNYGTISGATWTNGIGAPVAQTSVIDWNKHTLDGTNSVLIPQGLTTGRDLLGNLFENVRKQSALNLDGQSWAEVHDNESLDFGTGSFTLEAWVIKNYVNSGSSLNIIMSLGNNITGANNTGLTVNSTNVAFKYTQYHGHNVTTGDWVHVVGVYDETNVILYVDGVAETTTARTAINVTNALTKYIGRDSTTLRYYSDQIAQPRIYNRALTNEEVQRNYNAGKNIYS